MGEKDRAEAEKRLEEHKKKLLADQERLKEQRLKEAGSMDERQRQLILQDMARGRQRIEEALTREKETQIKRLHGQLEARKKRLMKKKEKELKKQVKQLKKGDSESKLVDADKSDAAVGKDLFDSAGTSKGLEGIKVLEKIADPVGKTVQDAAIDENLLRQADEAKVKEMEENYKKALRAQAEALSAEEKKRKE